MMTMNSTPAVDLIPVQRRPHLAKKIPIVASINHNTDEQRIIEKWRGTTPHGREIIRKKLWKLQREMKLGLYAKHWTKITSMFPADLFAQALSVQDQEVAERISRHLSETQQWPVFLASVEQAAKLFEPMKYWAEHIGHSGAVELFKRIAADYADMRGSAASRGSGQSIFAEQSRF